MIKRKKRIYYVSLPIFDRVKKKKSFFPANCFLRIVDGSDLTYFRVPKKSVFNRFLPIYRSVKTFEIIVIA